MEMIALYKESMAPKHWPKQSDGICNSSMWWLEVRVKGDEWESF